MNTRVRLTITLTPEIIKDVDEVAKSENRTRSNVIETALVRAFQSKSAKARLVRQKLAS